VENEGPRIRCFIDGNLVVSAEDSEIGGGKAGVTANVPARFQDFRVRSRNVAALMEGMTRRVLDERDLRSRNPKPVLWRKFETKDFGCGRNVRFGDLDGDGIPEMLFCQIVPKVDTGNFVEASCLTAVKLDGTVLWQVGKPNPMNGLLTSDTPFQIHNGEVYLVKDFKLPVLDGKRGR
jgi:hypothetical protein